MLVDEFSGKYMCWCWVLEQLNFYIGGQFKEQDENYMASWFGYLPEVQYSKGTQERAEQQRNAECLLLIRFQVSTSD